MNKRQIQLAQALTLAGILPPWLSLGLYHAAGMPLAAYAALAYGAVIASFVCGMHWGLYLQRPDSPVNLLATSNVGALAAWGAVLAFFWSGTLAFLMMTVVLALMLIIDQRLLKAGIIAPWFWRVRIIATVVLGGGLVAWSVSV